MLTTLRKKLSPYLPPAILFGATILLLSAINTFATDVSLLNKLQDFFTLSLSIFIEAFPFLVLGSLLASLVNLYVPAHTFERILPKNTFFKRAIISLLGFMFPVCECGNVPLSRALIIQGLKPSEAVTFLLAAPVINPVTIWSTWVAFSYDESIVLSRIAATFVIANFIGFVLSLRKNEQEFLTEDFVAICDKSTTSPKPRKLNLTKLGDSFTHEAYTMIKMLAFGVLIAGIIQTFIPRDILTSIGSNILLSILAMLIMAFVVSICANVDAFFALSFANTFTAGSIVSFLVFGPMIDIKILALLKTTFKNNLLITITVLAFLLSALTGLVVSYAF